MDGWGKIFKKKEKKKEGEEEDEWGEVVCIEPHRKAGDRTRVST